MPRPNAWFGKYNKNCFVHVIVNVNCSIDLFAYLVIFAAAANGQNRRWLNGFCTTSTKVHLSLAYRMIFYCLVRDWLSTARRFWRPYTTSFSKKMIGLKVDNQEKWESIEDKPLYCLQCCQIKKIAFLQICSTGYVRGSNKHFEQYSKQFRSWQHCTTSS